MCACGPSWSRVVAKPSCERAATPAPRRRRACRAWRCEALAVPRPPQARSASKRAVGTQRDHADVAARVVGGEQEAAVGVHADVAPGPCRRRRVSEPRSTIRRRRRCGRPRPSPASKRVDRRREGIWRPRSLRGGQIIGTDQRGGLLRGHTATMPSAACRWCRSGLRHRPTAF